MRIVPRVIYRYCCIYSAVLCCALDEAGIGYTLDTLPERIVICTLDGETLHGSGLQPLLDARRITCISSLRFTKRELRDAPYFSLRCNYNKLEPASGTQPFDFSCIYAFDRAQHRVQTAPFTLAKPFRWGTHSFVSELGNGTELFLKDRAKRSLEADALDGIDYRPVYRVGQATPLEDIFQLVPSHLLPTEALELPEEDISETVICPQCGRRQYVRKGHAQLRVRSAFLSQGFDLYATEELFGAGFAQRGLIVSQKFYQCVEKNALGRNLVFEPVILSDTKEGEK